MSKRARRGDDQALGEVTKTTTLDGARTFDVKLPDGTSIKVTEVPDAAAEWLAELRSKLLPDQLKRLDAMSKNRTPSEVFNLLKGDTEYAVDSLSSNQTKGAKDTIELYVNGPVPESGQARWDYLAVESNWKPERQALHRKLIAAAKAEAQKFADVAARNGRGATIYAMRGNTAAGKSRTAKGRHPPSSRMLWVRSALGEPGQLQGCTDDRGRCEPDVV